MQFPAHAEVHLFSLLVASVPAGARAGHATDRTDVPVPDSGTC
ncbi:hypothetical protein STTU_5899 [Streptomyces sp. Tu6071]|nr:hypothetical protein STTU_5899 [Streptomyces sp. Tu6071]